MGQTGQTCFQQQGGNVKFYVYYSLYLYSFVGNSSTLLRFFNSPEILLPLIPDIYRATSAFKRIPNPAQCDIGRVELHRGSIPCYFFTSILIAIGECWWNSSVVWLKEHCTGFGISLNALVARSISYLDTYLRSNVADRLDIILETRAGLVIL